MSEIITENIPFNPEAYNSDGTFNESFFKETYGFDLLTITQEVTFGKYTDSFGRMLLDSRCPVGEKIRNVFQESGIESAKEKLIQFGKMFDVELDYVFDSAKTANTEIVEKKK